ncbi:MAG TPA: histidine phosphatase family protein [Steroidobacteraceae bacterium]|nr:histidine phosphatase family protein [Steroidobacteraceae bacterium]
MSETTQRVFLVRHGETEWSLHRKHTGLTDIPLTDNGRSDARKLRPVLAREKFDLVLVSPLKRARETCDLAGFGSIASVDENLREWNYGDYEGLTTQQIRATSPNWQLFDDGCPGGETPADVGARVDRVIERTRGINGDIALFAHGHLLRVLAARWIGLSVAAGAFFELDTATLSVLGSYDGINTIERWNSSIDT